MRTFNGVGETYDAILWPSLVLAVLIKFWHQVEGQEIEILGDVLGWAWIFMRLVLCIWSFAWLITRIKNL